MTEGILSAALGAAKDVKNESEKSREYWAKRNQSIERQVAVKCVATLFQGKDVNEEQFVKAFNIFLALIRG